MIDPGSEIDIAGHFPDFLQGRRIVDVTLLVLDHQRDTERIAKAGMRLEDLHERVILRQQIGEDGAQVHTRQSGGKKCGDQHKDRPGEPTMGDHPARDTVTQGIHKIGNPGCNVGALRWRE